MKWRYPKLGDTRVVWRLHFFPRRYGAYTYWLHPMRVYQEYEELWCTSTHRHYKTWVTKGPSAEFLINRMEGKTP
jgi:hypothetical protein